MSNTNPFKKSPAIYPINKYPKKYQSDKCRIKKKDEIKGIE